MTLLKRENVFSHMERICVLITRPTSISSTCNMKIVCASSLVFCTPIYMVHETAHTHSHTQTRTHIYTCACINRRALRASWPVDFFACDMKLRINIHTHTQTYTHTNTCAHHTHKRIFTCTCINRRALRASWPVYLFTCYIKVHIQVHTPKHIYTPHAQTHIHIFTCACINRRALRVSWPTRIE